MEAATSTEATARAATPEAVSAAACTQPGLPSCAYAMSAARSSFRGAGCFAAVSGEPWNAAGVVGRGGVVGPVLDPGELALCEQLSKLCKMSTWLAPPSAGGVAN